MNIDEATAVVKYVDNRIQLYFDKDKKIENPQELYSKSVEAARTLVRICVFHQKELEKMPNFSIDDDVAIPPEGYSEPEKVVDKPKPDPPKSKASSTSADEPSKEEYVKYKDELSKDYSRLPELAAFQVHKACNDWYMIWFVPTERGAKQYGWTKTLLCTRLYKYFEAVHIKNQINLNSLGLAWGNFATIETKHVEATMSGGFNYEFDANQYAPEQFGSSHPTGRFLATITDTQCLPNSQNTGANYVVEFTTDGGSIKKYYALWNDKHETVKKAHQQLSALSHATGIYRISMNDGGKALIGGKCMIDVGKQADNEQYSEIKKIYDVNGNVPGRANPQGQQQGGGQPQGQGMPQGQGNGPNAGYSQQGGPQGGGYGQQGPGPNQGGGYGGYGGYGGPPQGQGGSGYGGPNQGGGYQPGPQGGQQGGYNPHQQGGYNPQQQGGPQGGYGGPNQGYNPNQQTPQQNGPNFANQPPQDTGGGGGQWNQNQGGGDQGGAPSWANN